MNEERLQLLEKKIDLLYKILLEATESNSVGVIFHSFGFREEFVPLFKLSAENVDEKWLPTIEELEKYESDTKNKIAAIYQENKIYVEKEYAKKHEIQESFYTPDKKKEWSAETLEKIETNIRTANSKKFDEEERLNDRIKTIQNIKYNLDGVKKDIRKINNSRLFNDFITKLGIKREIEKEDFSRINRIKKNLEEVNDLG